MRIFGILLALLVSTSARAVDLTWGGLYRAEATSVLNSGLDEGDGYDKSYLLHHLILDPKIVAADGLTLYGRVDIFNNRHYNNSQMGEFFGGAPATGSFSGTSGTAVNSENQKSEWVQIRYFYLKWATEYGALFVGRTPIHFGLGITHNAGNGDFDHYYDSKDLLGYKFIAGNLSFMPMYGKVKENDLQFEDDINDYMFQFQYENPDTDLNLGLFYQARVATKNANDAPSGEYSYGGTGATGPDGSYEVKTLNLFVSRALGHFKFGFESSFQNGKTGIKDSAGREVNIDGYGIATEFAWMPPGRWSFDLRTGIATGDDPNTTDKYEGFLFDRNYDVGMLLFNHVLGGMDERGAVPPYSNRAYDVLGTKDFRNGGKSAADVEYLTNAVYLAPGAKWQVSDAWNINTHVVWAQLQRGQRRPSADDISNSLGVEWDIGLNYKPHERLNLEIGSALFWPGDAFRGGTLNLPWEFAYGLQTKAAVRF